MPPEFQASRGEILRQLQEELVGPAPTGTALETALPVSFDTKESAYGPFTTQDGEEVLQRVRPLKRYGVGVLYPRGTAGGDAVQEDPATGNGGDLDQVGEALEDELADQELGVDDPLAATAVKDLNQLSARAANGGRTRDDGDEFDLSPRPTTTDRVLWQSPFSRISHQEPTSRSRPMAAVICLLKWRSRASTGSGGVDHQ